LAVFGVGWVKSEVFLFKWDLHDLLMAILDSEGEWCLVPHIRFVRIDAAPFQECPQDAPMPIHGSPQEWCLGLVTHHVGIDVVSF